MRKFHARCRIGRWVPLAEVLTWPREDQPDGTRSRWDHKLECEVVPVTCDREFTDPAAFDQHMKDLHGKKPITGDSAPLVKRTRGKWRGPRLTDEGKPFEPKDLEPGATVTWRELVGTGVFRTERRYDYVTKQDIPFEVEEREPVERSGQVWSSAPYPKSAWVVPFEPFEGEFAVLVREDRWGRLEHSQTWSTAGYKDESRGRVA